MKKGLLVFLALMLVLALCACGTSDSSTDTPNTAATTPTKAEQTTESTTAPTQGETATNPTETTPAQTESVTQPTETTPSKDETPAETTHTHSWKAATCTSPKTCSTCKATEGKAAGHTWKAATCTVAKTCSTCKATEGKALGHTWKDATCTAAKTCSICNITTGNAAGHKASEWIIEKEATCTTDGSKYQKCTVCNKTINTQTIAGGHKYEETVINATETTGAYISYECSVCKHSYTKDISPISVSHSITGMSSVSGPWGSSVSYTYEIYANGGYGRLQYKFMQGSRIIRDFSTNNEITLSGSGLLSVIVKDEAGQETTYQFYI